MKGGPIRVLLVEDSVDDVDLFKLAARKCSAPLEIATVPDGEEALRYLKRMNSYTLVKLPNVILLDLNMPRMNGREALREIKNDSLLRRIPVIVLTTSQSPADISECYAGGVACYLVKPDTFEELQSLACKLSDFWSLSEYAPELQKP